MNEEKNDQNLRVKIVSAPESVPVFNCVVHLKANAGIVTAKIANLESNPFTAKSEVLALKQAVQHFKKQVSQSVASGEKPPLINPTELLPGEECRLIAVHL